MSKTETSRLGARGVWAVGTVFGAGLLLAFAAGRFWPAKHVAQTGGAGPAVAQHATRDVPVRTPRSPVPTPTEVADDEAAADHSEAEAVVSAPTKRERGKVVQFDELKREVETEVRDTAWQREVEVRLASTLKQEEANGTFGGPVSIVRTACGSTRCTIEGEAATKRDASSLSRAITRGVGLARGRIYTNRRDDGTAIVRVVAAREGYDLFGMQEHYLAEGSN